MHGFARFGTARPTLSGILRQLAPNLLVSAYVAGIAKQAGSLRLSSGLEGAVRLGQMLLPLGVPCVGASLD